MSMRRKTAIVGIGATPYYRRGRSAPRTLNELVGTAILAAIADAGLQIEDVDGFAYYGGGFDTPYLCEMLGIPEVRFTAGLTGSGGGSAGAIGLASAAVIAGLAETVVCVGGMQQTAQRYGTITSAYAPDPENAFFLPAGLVGPGHMFALLARRHMHLYGTTRDHFAEVAISNRINALTHPDATIQKPLAREDYFAAPLLADPHCLFDFCLENDGAIAAIVTSAERARDLRRKPVSILASTHGGEREWGRSLYWMNMSDDLFASSGHRSVARRLYADAGLGPQDIDCAQIYDHFTSQVIMQLEDYGFCEIGEGGPFVASGAIRREGGSLPINTDGGQLSCGYIWGMTHIREAVEQIRGTAANQIDGVETALVTGGPSNVPVSGLILAAA
ncbi:thiolase C-terminal domain-containing protein [Enterovirga sp. CN4-39]|uniref:thiolase C-terminal domain-containing protein n=1 Tax=Enterovirga sp. CN4-39 TaxID=3400910 RepID=UPI003BFC2FC5